MLSIHDGRVELDGSRLSLQELQTLRPGFSLPVGIVTIRYDGFRHERSDGRNQYPGPIPWNVGDGLILDAAALKAELEVLRAPAVTLDSAKTDKRVEINHLRDQKIFAGLTYQFPDGGSGTIDTREQSDFDNLQALTTLAQVLQANGETAAVITFVDVEDQAHELTPTQMIDLGVAVTLHVAAIYAASWPLKAAVKSAANLAEVAAVDIFSGWP